jgi:hypothetical protein
MWRLLIRWIFGDRRSSLELGYGLWRDHKVDDLEYQIRIRSEWPG